MLFLGRVLVQEYAEQSIVPMYGSIWSGYKGCNFCLGHAVTVLRLLNLLSRLLFSSLRLGLAFISPKLPLGFSSHLYDLDSPFISPRPPPLPSFKLSCRSLHKKRRGKKRESFSFDSSSSLLPSTHSSPSSRPPTNTSCAVFCWFSSLPLHKVIAPSAAYSLALKDQTK
ncbi:hypothetical protein ACLOJK_032619 [Asimina triloba]